MAFYFFSPRFCFHRTFMYQDFYKSVGLALLHSYSFYIPSCWGKWRTPHHINDLWLWRNFQHLDFSMDSGHTEIKTPEDIPVCDASRYCKNLILCELVKGLEVSVSCNHYSDSFHVVTHITNHITATNICSISNYYRNLNAFIGEGIHVVCGYPLSMKYFRLQFLHNTCRFHFCQRP